MDLILHFAVPEFAFGFPSYTFLEDVGTAVLEVHLVNGTLERSADVVVNFVATGMYKQYVLLT